MLYTLKSTLGIFVVLMVTTFFDVQAQCRGTLLFQDEFSGSSLDVTKWNYETGNGCPGLCGWGNNEKEYYTSSSQNVSVSGGYLNLTARSSPNHLGSGSDFTSGKINTKNKFDRLYGRFEASIKMPVGVGIWPAFWLLPTDYEYGGWPTSGEIDVVEYRGDQTNSMGATLHYGNSSPNNRYDATFYTLASGNFSSTFHQYAVEWEPGEMRFYVDNKLIKTETQSPNSLVPASNNAVTWPWDKRFYIILNLALGGWYTGNPSTVDINAGTTFPQSMQVDYVRVYDMVPNSTQAPFLGSAITLPGKVEAEYYNEGCNTFAYNDVDATNTGNVLRSDDVDIEETNDGAGGYNVGWTAAGEWLKYAINVQTSGAYDIQFRVASNTNARSLHLEIDDVDITGTVAVPNTGGWQTWQTVTLSNINLDFGPQELKLVFDTPDININYINFALINSSNLPPVVTITSPLTGSTYSSPATFTIEATASDDGSINKVEFYNGTSLLKTDTSVPYTCNVNGLGVGTYTLRAVAFDNELESSSHSISVTVNATTGIEEQEALNNMLHIYPNPFSGQAVFSIEVQELGSVSLAVYNELGVIVKEFVTDQELAIGAYSFEWSALDLPAQVYTCVFQNNGRVVRKKVVRF